MNRATSINVATVCVRSLTCQMIARVAKASGEQKSDVYGRIQARMQLHYSIDLTELPRNEGEGLLAVAERHDLIDKVYAFAYAEYLYLQSYQE